MIDLHSHILPQMDDGSKSTEETEKLLQMLKAQGVTELAATPHFYADRERPEDFLRRREEALSRMPETDLPLHIGAEVAYFPGMQNCEDLISLQLGSTRLLLVEMPFRPWTDRMAADICAIPVHLGLTPVLAHIDRYRGGRQFPKYFRQLLESDVLFQCNADAFEKLLSRSWALKQLKHGLIHFLGSDSHNLTTRAPRLELAANSIRKKLGPEFFADFTDFSRQLLHQE